MCKKFLPTLTLCLVLISGCAGKIDENDPISVVYNFILLCEKGKVEKAESLLAKRHNVDYMDKFKHLNGGKDLFYIDYDYKGNDDTLELSFEFLEDESSPSVAVVKMNSNYKKQKHEFEKEIVLHMEGGKWRIYEFLFTPVRVD